MAISRYVVQQDDLLKLELVILGERYTCMQVQCSLNLLLHYTSLVLNI